MAFEPEQIPSRTCDCRDCTIDYPPAEYGQRTPQTACQGPWGVRYRVGDSKQRMKNNLRTLHEARQHLATVQQGATRNAS